MVGEQSRSARQRQAVCPVASGRGPAPIQRVGRTPRVCVRLPCVGERRWSSVCICGV